MTECDVPGCGPAKILRRGMCGAHYERRRTGRPLDAPLMRRAPLPAVCVVDGCGRKPHSRGRCSSHVLRDGPIRDLAPRGAGWVDTNGYRKIAGVAEHRAVMERVLGRPLFPGENVHHRNGVRSDNRPENLELWVVSQPKGQRVPDLLDWAREIIGRYGD